MSATLVAAIAENGVIGRDGGLPWPRLPGELPRFKALTTGHVLVMGSRTFDSIGRALPDRTTVVVSRQRRRFADGVVVLPTVAEAVAHARTVDPAVFVAGGARVYADALAAGLVGEMVITHVHGAHDGEVVFPAVDWSAWSEVSRAPGDGYDVVTYLPAA